MKRFYTTSTDVVESNHPKETIAEALAEAKKQVEEANKRRYVVQVIYRIEPAKPPVRIVRIK